ncbi:hypothetical protein C2G38_2214435 [Gigaspora rosea]|uniref:F-box domain-containing protein n=1 Tax=Gigaspora rosea TaxID=44941 RepID=A0A397UF85_9GLOM|nr:hypothetical protein C2G38_2214435 [Gigaspora rosea]
MLKIFMGDMPNLMESILYYVKRESHFESLYLCALVSRYWCRISISIFWENPFAFRLTKPTFISKYFSSLGEDEKLVLKECGINKEIPETLFKYARFLKVFDLDDINYDVEQWVDVPKQSYARIINLLIKIIVDSRATLYQLTIINLDIEALLGIVKSQQLRRVEIKTTKLRGIISALKYQTILKEVVVTNCSYIAEFEVLNNSKYLEILCMRYCNKKLLRTLNCKISTLEISGLKIEASTIVQILKKSELLLQRLKIASIRIILEESL